jgi:hypothetical protein
MVLEHPLLFAISWRSGLLRQSETPFTFLFTPWFHHVQCLERPATSSGVSYDRQRISMTQLDPGFL